MRRRPDFIGTLALKRQDNSALIRGSLRLSQRHSGQGTPAGPILPWLRAAVPLSRS